MGTQDRPASSVLSGPFSHNVFLLVVVDRRNETWLCLFGWSVERPKTEAVGLRTAGQHDALKRDIAHGKSVERVFQHSGIWLNGFSHRGFLDVGSEDQIGHLIERRKDFRRALAVQEIDPDVRGCGVRPVDRRGSARSCGDPPFWVLCDGVDDTCTEDAIGSNKQDLAFRDGCFRSGGHGQFTLPIKPGCTSKVASSPTEPVSRCPLRARPQLSETSLITISTAVGPWTMGPSGLRLTTRRKVGTTIPSKVTWSKQ